MWNAGNLDEREIPPMSAEMFSALVTARLRPLEGVEILGGKGLQLRLRLNGHDTTAQLERYYERYRANPAALSPAIDQFIQSLLEGVSDASAGNARFAEVRSLLLPRLMTAQEWMNKRDQGLRLVVRSIVQDLGATLIVDRGDAFEYVQLDAIPAWEIDAQTGFDAALDNLERASREAQTSANGEGLETLLLDHGANAASRVMLAGRLAEWQARIEGELVVGIPTHELLVGFSREHPAFDALRAQIEEDAQTAPNGLSGSLLLVRQGGLELVN